MFNRSIRTKNHVRHDLSFMELQWMRQAVEALLSYRKEPLNVAVAPLEMVVITVPLLVDIIDLHAF